MEQRKAHFLVVSLGAQGHINPTLQFAKQLLLVGAHVTFATNTSAHARMNKNKATLPKGISFVAFPDLCDGPSNNVVHPQLDLDSVTADTKTIEPNLEDDVQASIDSVPASFDHKQASIDAIPASFDNRQANIDTVQASFDHKQASLGIVQASFDHKQASIDAVPASFDHKQANIDTVQASFDHKQASIDTVQASFDHKQASTDAVPGSFDHKQASLDVVPASFDHKQSSIDTVPGSFDHKQAKIDVVQPSFDHKQASIDTVQASFDQNQASLDTVNSNVGYVQANSNQVQMYHFSKTLIALCEQSTLEERPITCIVYTFLLPWAGEVARKLNISSALLWIQPATAFNVYYHYTNEYHDSINECLNNPTKVLRLPNIPLDLTSHDLPTTPPPCVVAPPLFPKQLQEFEKHEKPKILVNTFDALEANALRSVDKFDLIPIGPLLPLDPLDKTYGGDLFKQPNDEKDYMKWLNSQEKSSVIYVSFGSISVLSKAQIEELAYALLETNKPFLWVIREQNESYTCLVKKLEQKGLIVPWCSQVEVLSNPSVGCFLTHCGWNSTLESISIGGVPLVAMPLNTDQPLNAKLVEDVWKIGVRVNKSCGEKGLVKKEEIQRCIQHVMNNDEIKENAMNLRKLATQALVEGGSSTRNFKLFMKQVC
ncbi:hypothetical protein vseg_014351 [Gypsophila vaccaria]